MNKTVPFAKFYSKHFNFIKMDRFSNSKATTLRTGDTKLKVAKSEILPRLVNMELHSRYSVKTRYCTQRNCINFNLN